MDQRDTQVNRRIGPRASSLPPSAGAVAEQPELPGFRVTLHNFQGPFDLLLQLISAKKMDVTEIALAEVTDEFIDYTRALGQTADLDETTEFLVISATLLEMKTRRLLPRSEEAEEEDAEFLESRDLLFARLLQYKAYKQVAEQFAVWQRSAQRRYPRAVSLEESFANLLPPVTLKHTPESFAELAASVFRAQPPTEVATEHVHAVAVSVPEQAGKIMASLTAAGRDHWLNFDTLTQDCQRSIEIVGRFLALLELYKAKAVDTSQPEALATLSVAWTGLSVDPAVVAAQSWD